MRKAIFLDRDGTIIKARHFVSSPRQVRVLPGAITALKRLKQAGYLLVLITNQSGIARGRFTEVQLKRVHQYLQNQLENKGITLDAIYYCPHHAEGVMTRYRRRCSCRKPESGMLRKAAKDLKINLKKSVMIGDALRDLQSGKKVKTRTALVLTGLGEDTYNRIHGTIPYPADYVARDLLEAAKWILST